MFKTILLLALFCCLVHCQDIFAAISNDDEESVLKVLNTYSPNMVNKQDPTSRPINRKGHGGQTPLMYAVLNGKIWAVKILLEYGANFEIKEENGYTPMHGAGFQGRPEIAQMLIDHGIPVNPKHKDGFAPIHRACWGKEQRHADTVKVFLNNGVDIDTLADDGRTCVDMTPNEETKKVLDHWETHKVL